MLCVVAARKKVNANWKQFSSIFSSSLEHSVLKKSLPPPPPPPQQLLRGRSRLKRFLSKEKLLAGISEGSEASPSSGLHPILVRSLSKRIPKFTRKHTNAYACSFLRRQRSSQPASMWTVWMTMAPLRLSWRPSTGTRTSLALSLSTLQTCTGWIEKGENLRVFLLLVIKLPQCWL